jgi:hypothetical protein
MKSIIFITLLVMRIIQGLKTQTRRIINHPLDDRGPRKVGDTWEDWHGQKIKCPYKVGDQLYVREEHYRYGQWIIQGKTKTGRDKRVFVPSLHNKEVRFPNHTAFQCMSNSEIGVQAWYKRISRFMPAKAARITLEVTNVRAERVCDITDSDALAEGIENRGALGYSAFGIDQSETPRAAFLYLWDVIHSPELHTANPWVWVFDFKVVSIKKEAIFL